MCDYKGYGTAMTNNNFTLYNSLTVPGLPGDTSECMNIPLTTDAQYSFPSGHSSSSFCALVFCSLVMMFTLHTWTRKHNMIKGALVCVFIWSSAIIAGTRPRDYWHNFDDILAGAAIGSGMAIIAFYLNYVSKMPETTDKEDEGFRSGEGPSVY